MICVRTNKSYAEYYVNCGIQMRANLFTTVQHLCNFMNYKEIK